MAQLLDPQARRPKAAACCTACRDRRKGFCCAIGEAARDRLSSQSRTVTLEPGHILIDGENLAAAVWIVQSGVLRIQRFGAAGRRQIVGLFLPGEVVEKDFPDTAGCTVEAATPVGLRRIDRRDFSASLDRMPSLRRTVTRQRLDRLERTRWLICALGALRPEERICAFLALMTRFLPVQPLDDGGVILWNAVPRADIADLLATSAETYSRVTHRLQDAGVLVIEDAEHFRILDLPALAGMGCLDGAPLAGSFTPRSTAGSASALS